MILPRSSRLARAAAPSRAGYQQLALLALSVALGLIAQAILRKRIKSPVQDDKPTTLTSRGSYMNWLIGIRRVGPVFAWAGDREKRKEEAPGGKNLSGGPKVDVWFEAGWHQLAVGPCHALHQILQSGKVIFSGPITPDSHPSGTTVDLGAEGAFTIFWGETTQPVNTFLGAASRVGVASRWPYCCYVVWNKKRLGQSPLWPILDYVLERRPSGAFLTLSQSWYQPTKTLSGITFPVVAFVANASPDVGYLEVVGDASQELDPNRDVKIAGNGLPNGDYVVRKTAVVRVVVGTGHNGFSIFEVRTRVFLQTGTAGANASGTLEPYVFATDDGANIAHVVADLLFADWPHGLGLDPAGPEPWDLASLEAWGQEAQTLGLRASVIAVDGESADALLGAILQDHGVMLPIDQATGRLTFRRIREPVPPVPIITADVFADDHPQREGYLGERPVDKAVFQFTDRDHSFGDMTIGVAEDGGISYLEFARAKIIPIVSTVHFKTAAVLSEQRSQEDLAGASRFPLQLSRGARELTPGDALVVDGFDEILRAVEVEIDPLSESITVTTYPDSYGARRSDFENEPGGGNPALLEPKEDLFRFAEVPEQLLSVEEMRLQVLRIRAHAQIIEAGIHLSRDDVTYTLIGTESGVGTGGTLDSQLSSATFMRIAQGPTITIYGPDAASALDLSADNVNFGLGRQLAVIVSSAGTEICFLKKLTAVGGSTFRLDGLLRSRYDARRLTHPAGSFVCVFTNTTFEPFSDALLEPDQDLFVKSQPVATSGALPLAAVAPHGDLLRGKGLKPIDPENVRVRAPHRSSNSYAMGNAVTVRWSWSSAASKNTGAGFQSSGTPIGAPTMKGAFVVELRTAAGALVRTDTVQVPEITYTNATLAAPPISEGDFRVRVFHQHNGLTSGFSEVLVVKV